MQISNNTTYMEAGITTAMDKDGRDSCVVVVKGTFLINKNGVAGLAEEQEPFVYADKHYGESGSTSIQYECDFAPFKPRTDIIINGHAYAPHERPALEFSVSFQIGKIKKNVRVVGDRFWERSILKLLPTDPKPFVKMPFLFEKAYGGSDHTHDDPKYHGTEMRNPVGVGFFKNPDSKVVEGTPLPNIEDPDHSIKKYSDTPNPVGFGTLGRNWQPRIRYAGTYDESWLNNKFPFLPDDFDMHYFQSAPVDQQVDYLQGGEEVLCRNMTPGGSFKFTIPGMNVPLLFQFRDKEVEVKPNLDTLIIEPDERRIILLWRANVPVGRKLNALREVLVGIQPESETSDWRQGKRYFKSLSEFIGWKRDVN